MGRVQLLAIIQLEEEPRRGEVARFQKVLGTMGYKFQLLTLAGFHSLNLNMFDLAQGYKETGMQACSQLQQQEFACEPAGYEGAKHQRFVGTGYFDLLAKVVGGALLLSPRSKDRPRPSSSFPCRRRLKCRVRRFFFRREIEAAVAPL